MSSRNADAGAEAVTPEVPGRMILSKSASTGTPGPSNHGPEVGFSHCGLEHVVVFDHDQERADDFERRRPVARRRPSTRPRTTWVDDFKDRTVGFFNRNAGLLLVASAQAFISMMNVTVKTLNEIDASVPTMELITARMIITYLCCMVWMLSMGVPDPVLGPKGVRLLLVSRGSTGFVGLFGLYYSLQYLSLSDSTVLTFLAPLCTAMAGAVLLGENFARREAFAGIISLIGVVLIARPTALFDPSSDVQVDGMREALTSSPEKGTSMNRLIAVGVALTGVLGGTAAYISIRAAGKRVHPLHSMSFFSSFSVIISSIGMVASKTQLVIPTRWDWYSLLTLIAIFGLVGQTLLTMGLQRETAGRGTIAVYTQIVFATILELIFFHTLPSALSLIGTSLIIGSALYVALTKEKEDFSKSQSESKLISLQQLTADTEVEEGLLNSYSIDVEYMDSEKNVEIKPEGRHVFEDEYTRVVHTTAQ